MSAVDMLQTERDAAQIELAEAEIALAEASARAVGVRERAARLDSAIAALNGESPTPSAPARRENFAGEALPCKEAEEGSSPSRGPTDIDNMTPEEFDAYRRRRQRAREKEEIANNPLAHVKCAGCGTAGKMTEQMITAPSGAPVRMLVCGKCGNQVL